MNDAELHAFSFECGQDELVGITHVPSQPETTGILFVVGGPQYRVGSHRQFILLSRHLSASGFASMRFDHHGTGDSEGNAGDFREIGDDIRAAIDQFLVRVPSLQRIVIWGLCDAASSALMYVASDTRVHSLILLNPWVRNDESLAKAYVTKYYGSRLVSREFWRDLISGDVQLWPAAKSFAANLYRGFVHRKVPSKDSAAAALDSARPQNYIANMLHGLSTFKGRVLFILSADDITAAEFSSLIKSDSEWSEVCSAKNVVISRIAKANHTFSTAEWRAEVARICVEWLTVDSGERKARRS